MKKLILLALIAAVSLTAAPTGAFAKEKEKGGDKGGAWRFHRHHHHRHHHRHHRHHRHFHNVK